MANNRWLCSVCGYIHVGATAPGCCPVCGVSAELFEPAAVAPPLPARTIQRWRCINCDFVHDGESPPESCMICGVGPEQFEPLEDEQQAEIQQSMTGSIVIVGGGIAGLSAAEAARKNAPSAAVTLISQERELPYYRLNLTRYLAGEITAGELPVHSEQWYADQNITILSGVEVTAIERAGKSVVLRDQQPVRYDRLILTTGAHPSVPPIAGMHRKRVVTLRTCRDADEILSACSEGTRCVIIGGGVLGLETAGALALRKCEVTLLEGYDWLLPRQLNRAAGERLAMEASTMGINLICGAKVKEIDGDEQVRSVVLESGSIMPADLVIVTAGVRSNSYLARMAGLEVGSGVIVDNHLRTTDPYIYAAGDLIEFQGVFYGAWAPAQYQGIIAGMNVTGAENMFEGVPRSNSLKVIGSDLFSIGLINPDDASYQVFEESSENYRLFVFRDSILMGAILLGDTSVAPKLKKLIENRTSCSDLLARVSDARSISSGIAAL